MQEHLRMSCANFKSRLRKVPMTALNEASNNEAVRVSNYTNVNILKLYLILI